MTETRPRDTDAGDGLVSRRSALRMAAGSAILLTVGCGGDVAGVRRATKTGSATTPAPTDADISLVRQAIASEERLAGFTSAAAHQFPTYRTRLSEVSEHQRLQVARLRAALTDLTPPVTRRHPPVPRRSTGLPTDLADLSLDARISRFADCLAATSGLLAELFASLAASHAVTVLAFEPAAATVTVSAPDSVPSADPLQPCLAAEHAAVFGYGVLGGVVSAGVSGTPVAKASVASYDAHRSRRDLLTDLITTAGGTPVAAEAAYDIPFPVAGPPTARRLAQYLEARCASVYARATAATTGGTRVMTSGTLIDCAVQAARWGAPPTAFPGLDAA